MNEDIPFGNNSVDNYRVFVNEEKGCGTNPANKNYFLFNMFILSAHYLNMYTECITPGLMFHTMTRKFIPFNSSSYGIWPWHSSFQLFINEPVINYTIDQATAIHNVRIHKCKKVKVMLSVHELLFTLWSTLKFLIHYVKLLSCCDTSWNSECMLSLSTTAQKAMLATFKNVLFPGHNHLLTTGRPTDRLTLWLSTEHHRLFCTVNCTATVSSSHSVSHWVMFGDNFVLLQYCSHSGYDWL